MAFDDGLRWQRDLVRKALEGDDPVAQALDSALIDDEPVTDEEAAAIEQAKAEVERGETFANIVERIIGEDHDVLVKLAEGELRAKIEDALAHRETLDASIRDWVDGYNAGHRALSERIRKAMGDE